MIFCTLFIIHILLSYNFSESGSVSIFRWRDKIWNPSPAGLFGWVSLKPGLALLSGQWSKTHTNTIIEWTAERAGIMHYAKNICQTTVNTPSSKSFKTALNAYLEPKSSQFEYKFHSKHSCEDDVKNIKEVFICFWLIIKFHC